MPDQLEQLFNQVGDAPTPNLWDRIVTEAVTEHGCEQAIPGRRRPFPILGLAFVAVFAVAVMAYAIAQGNDPTVTAGPPDTSASDKTSTTSAGDLQGVWRLREWRSGSAAPELISAEDPSVTMLRINDGQIIYSTLCGGKFRPARFEAGVILVNPDGKPVTTDGCSPLPWPTNSFFEGAEIETELEGDELTLRNQQSAVEFIAERVE